MSISNTTRKTAVMQGNGTSTKFPFTFRINNEDDLKVYVKIGDGAYTLQTRGTDYTLTDLTYDSNNNISGGNMTLNSALTTSDYIYGIRETPNTQLESSEQVSFKSKDIERALDKATMQIQELSEDVSRSIRVEEWQTIDPDEILDAIFEAEGNAGTYATNAANSASAASTSENNASTYAGNSQKWAEGTDAQVSALGGTHSAKTYANQAASSVSQCETIANNAISSINRPLLSFIWSDHTINNQSWLRADTFSWQSGTTYSNAYQHLVADITNITASTETISGTTITYYQATDGHKIVLADQETNVSTIYTATGVAWYYVLDTTNTRFKLPRTKYAFTGLRDTVGKYIEAGLPNITGQLGPSRTLHTYSGTQVDTTGAFKKTSISGTRVLGASDENSYVYLYEFDASASNSIYGNSTTVQSPATQMYLYFYVGQFTQSATEQTAGLNAELFNGKADINLLNVSHTSGFRKLIEVYKGNDGSWYKVFAEYDPSTSNFVGNWCEQGGSVAGGGRKTVTYLKPFIDTNYTIVSTAVFEQGDYSTTAEGISSKTATSVNVDSRYLGAEWYACGYIA